MMNRAMFQASIFIFLLLLCGLTAGAQVLKPGFDLDEYLGVLRRSTVQVDVEYRGDVPRETGYTRAYRSPVVGLANRYDIWLSKDKQTITVNLRGTTSDFASWLENFYSAMIPATGSLKLNDSFTFSYKFAADPKAAVHVGWAIGIGAMAPDIMDKIQLFYSRGATQLIVEGHSQGGALAYLLSSYLHYQQVAGKLPSGLIIKTYCSAAPKPGNLYYAYDFDYINRGGWAFNVVNALDWVPETPISIQTIHDFNKVNPFINAKKQLHHQKLLVRMYTDHIYNKLINSTHKAESKYERYLGKIAYKRVKKFLPQYQQPVYLATTNYMRAGTPVILEPDEEYYKKFPDTGANVFRHHLFEPYYFQVRRQYGSAK